MSHTCPAPECGASVPDSMLACAPDWFRLPKGLRNRITVAWAGGEGRGSDAHTRLLHDAYQWYKDNPVQRA